MNGESVSAPIFEDITYRNIDINSDSIWSLLLFTGYLKPIKIYKGEQNLTYFDGIIPNKEIQTIYQTSIMQWFQEKVQANSRNDLFEAIINGNSQKFEEILCDWLKPSAIIMAKRTTIMVSFQDYCLDLRAISSNRIRKAVTVDRIF